jgi:glycosyltransferase involved in cell wall biosynthesis
MAATNPSLAGATVVIPSLDPPIHLVQYVEALTASGFGSVIVVNDGSCQHASQIFDDIRSLPNVVVIAHSENLGKGAALKTAFRHIQDTNGSASVVITADADGQHRVTDVVQVALRAMLATESATAVVFGVRSLTARSVPWKSRLGNRVSRVLVQWQSGRSIVDTQTGLRAYPAGLLSQLMITRGNRFDYEMHVLCALLRHRIPLVELPIKTIYQDSKNSTTHFRPLVDSAAVFLATFGHFLNVRTTPRPREVRW